MPLEAIVFLGILVALVVVGLPAIRSSVWLPPRLEIDQVPDAALTQAQTAHFAEIDRQLAALSYRPAVTFRATNLQGSNLTRAYLSDIDPAVVGASVLRAAQPATPITESYLEMFTGHGDGTVLSTRNANVSSLFEMLPQRIVQVFPGVKDAAALKRRHDARAEALRLHGPIFATRAQDVLDRFREYHERWCRFQQERGLLAYDAATDRLHPTPRTAWRGLRNFLNPMADNFTWPRCAAALLLGTALPAAGILAGSDPGSAPITWLRGVTGWPASACAHVLLAAVFSLAGVAAGWIFRTKTFVWALVLGLLPSYLLARTGIAASPYVLWMSVVADSVSRRVHRARALV